MDKFSKKSKEAPKEEPKEKVLFKNDYITVMDKDGWSFVKESDLVCVMPILVDRQQILIRYEKIPPFTLKDGKSAHVTAISGTMEEGETREQTLIREIEEEAGIRLKDSVAIEFFDKLYASKGNTMQINMCILPLYNYDFFDVEARGDGSKHEEQSSTVHLGWEHIDDIIVEDMVTRLLLNKTKEFLNI